MKSLFLLACLVYPSVVYGQTTLSELSDFADRVCQRAPLEGRNSDSELSAGAKADLTGFLKNALGLGFDARASRKDSSFSGVQQDKLADALAKGNECRTAVVHDFRDLVLRAPAPPPQPRPTPYVYPNQQPGPTPPAPPDTFAHDPVSGTYRGKMYYLLLVAGGNRSFAQDITLTINQPSGGSFRGTLIDDAQSKTLPVQGQFGGNSIAFQAVFADSGAGRLEMTFQGVLAGGGSIRGNFKVGGSLWQQTVKQIRAENGSVVDVVPSSFELRQ